MATATGAGQGNTYYIEGFDKFMHDLGVTPGRVKAAEKAFLQLAATQVMVWAKENARGEGGVAAKAAVDIRTGTIGQVKFGGKPYDLGAEFGSYRYRQFQPWRGNGNDSGYFLWPAIRRFRDAEMMPLWFERVWPQMAEAFTAK